MAFISNARGQPISSSQPSLSVISGRFSEFAYSIWPSTPVLRPFSSRGFRPEARNCLRRLFCARGQARAEQQQSRNLSPLRPPLSGGRGHHCLRTPISRRQDSFADPSFILRRGDFSGFQLRLRCDFPGFARVYLVPRSSFFRLLLLFERSSFDRSFGLARFPFSAPWPRRRGHVATTCSRRGHGVAATCFIRAPYFRNNSCSCCSSSQTRPFPFSYYPP